jgi:S-adenosylmethionine:tRNA ribosyltransferase-isomerase
VHWACVLEPRILLSWSRFSRHLLLASPLQMLLDFLPMRLEDLDYHLPASQIAQQPLDRRDASRLLEINRSASRLKEHLFRDLVELLRGDELVVLNNTRVIPARLFGRRAGVHAQPPSRTTRPEHLTGTVEVFLTRQRDRQTWEALVRPGRKMQTGERLLLGEGELEAEVISRGERGLRTLRFV